MKILVTGVGGQLGYDVCKVLDARKIENLQQRRCNIGQNAVMQLVLLLAY